MSLEALQAIAKHSEAEDSARLVALSLAFYAQRDTHLAWPSDRELMAFTRLSKGTLHKALRALEKAGEIHRRPRNSGDPRRTYLVNPRDGHQLSLPVEEGIGVHTFPAARKGTNTALKGTTHAGAGSNRLNRRTNTPPTPRRLRGARAPDLLGSLPGPCPGAQDSELWASMAGRLGERLGQSELEIWFADAHLHQAADGLVLALAPSTVSWVRKRFGAVLAAVAEAPVALVACQGVMR